MDLLIELVNRAGPMVMIGVGVVALAYWATRSQSRKSEREARERDARP